MTTLKKTTAAITSSEFRYEGDMEMTFTISDEEIKEWLSARDFVLSHPSCNHVEFYLKDESFSLLIDGKEAPIFSVKFGVVEVFEDLVCFNFEVLLSEYSANGTEIYGFLAYGELND